MRSMSSLIHKLKTLHPDISFVRGDSFFWAPESRTITYAPDEAHASQLTLHELSHALLGHTIYKRDVELLAMETAAWERAKALADIHSVRYSEDVTQDHLDTYRDWLHARSTCPHCTANGYQTATSHYECPACTHTWRVNEARLCALRRYSVTPKNPS